MSVGAPARLSNAPRELQPPVRRPRPARLERAIPSGRAGPARRRPPVTRATRSLTRQRTSTSARPRHEPSAATLGASVLEERHLWIQPERRRAPDESFSLEIQPGSRVALVGASGSGKSTIGRLVAGLYRPWEGEILYDGLRIDEIPREVFTSQVAMVDDQTFLFSGTVRDNLTLWDETIPDRDMIRAAIDSGIHRDVIRRRGGYHAGLTEGAQEPLRRPAPAAGDRPGSDP